MGNYKTTHRNVDNTKLPRMHPQPEYEIKTRAPTRNNPWRSNVLLKVREEQLADEAMPLARRKCYDPIMKFTQCQRQEGGFWYVFNCQEHFHYVAECLEHEYNVEMDRRRRNLARNPQKWWKELYDQNGEVGRQAQMPREEYTYLESWKYILFRIDKENKTSS